MTALRTLGIRATRYELSQYEQQAAEQLNGLFLLVRESQPGFFREIALGVVPLEWNVVPVGTPAKTVCVYAVHADGTRVAGTFLCIDQALLISGFELEWTLENKRWVLTFGTEDIAMAIEPDDLTVQQHCTRLLIQKRSRLADEPES